MNHEEIARLDHELAERLSAISQRDYESAHAESEALLQNFMKSLGFEKAMAVYEKRSQNWHYA